MRFRAGKGSEATRYNEKRSILYDGRSHQALEQVGKSISKYSTGTGLKSSSILIEKGDTLFEIIQYPTLLDSWLGLIKLLFSGELRFHQACALDMRSLADLAHCRTL